MSRSRIPEATLQRVLLQSGRRCPMCFLDGNDRAQQGSIAHLDRDLTNNAEDNLVYMCLTHHHAFDRGRIPISYLKKAQATLYSAMNEAKGEARRAVASGEPRLQYERLVVEAIREKLDAVLPDQIAVHRRRLYTGRSGNSREVDLAAEIMFAGLKLLVVFEIKNTKRKLGAAAVRSFVGLLNDIGANKGVIVSRAGFSLDAIRTAAANGIALMVFDEDSFKIEDNILDSLPI